MSKRRASIYPAACIGAIFLVTLFAPPEETLGNAMRWVYAHVGFVWAGGTFVNIAGLLGIVILIRPVRRLSPWLYPIETAAVGLYAVGFVLSLLAAWMSWGGVLWQEPAVLSSIVIIVCGIAAILVMRLVEHPRLQGLTAALYAVLVTYRLAVTERVFHPDEPIDASDSFLIKLTFYVVGILAIVLGASIVRIIGSRKATSASA